MQKHHIILVYSVAVKLDRIHAIFLGICLLDCHRRELTRFASRHKTASELVSHDRTADETARFDTYNLGYTLVLVEFSQSVAHDMQSLAILEQSCKIAENYPLRGKIGNIPDLESQIINFHISYF